MNQKVIIVRCEDIWSPLIGSSISDIPTKDEIKITGITDVMIESCGEGSILESMILFKLDKHLTVLDKLMNEIQFVIKEKKD